MRKILILFFSLLLFFAVCGFSQNNFRSTTTSNTAQTVSSTGCSLYHFNVLNTATVTIYVKLYDFKSVTTGTVSSVPSYTTTPTMTLQCTSQSEIWWYTNPTTNIPFIKNFFNGCYIRTVTGSADTYTVSPATSPIVEVTFGN